MEMRNPYPVFLPIVLLCISQSNPEISTGEFLIRFEIQNEIGINCIK